MALPAPPPVRLPPGLPGQGVNRIVPFKRPLPVPPPEPPGRLPGKKVPGIPGTTASFLDPDLACQLGLGSCVDQPPQQLPPGSSEGIVFIVWSTNDYNNFFYPDRYGVRPWEAVNSFNGPFSSITVEEEGGFPFPGPNTVNLRVKFPPLEDGTNLPDAVIGIAGYYGAGFGGYVISYQWNLRRVTGEPIPLEPTDVKPQGSGLPGANVGGYVGFAPPATIPDVIPGNLPDLYPGLPDPIYPDPDPEDPPPVPPPLPPPPDPDPPPDPPPDDDPPPPPDPGPGPEPNAPDQPELDPDFDPPPVRLPPPLPDPNPPDPLLDPWPEFDPWPLFDPLPEFDPFPFLDPPPEYDPFVDPIPELFPGTMPGGDPVPTGDPGTKPGDFPTGDPGPGGNPGTGPGMFPGSIPGGMPQDQTSTSTSPGDRPGGMPGTETGSGPGIPPGGSGPGDGSGGGGGVPPSGSGGVPPGDGVPPNVPDFPPPQKDPCDCYEKKLEEEVFWIDVSVKTVTCSLNADSGLYEATISNQVVQALATKNGNQAYTIEQQFERLAEIEKEQCEAKNQESVAYAAIPEQWDIKVGNNRPQLIIQFGEKLQGNKVDSPKYSIVIPWANTTTAIKNSPIGQWDKGKIRCSYEMPDNSKIIVFAKTENEGKRVINQALTVVQGNKKRSDNLIICTRIDSTRFKEITVVPRILRFFSTGQGKAIPDWEVTL